MNSFISHSKHPFISPFEDFIDIEYTRNINNVKNSEKTYIAWNWFSNIDIFSYRRLMGLPCICVERGALPGSIFFDKNGFNFDSASYKENSWNHQISKEDKARIQKYKLDFINESNPNLNLEFQKNNNISASFIASKINCDKFTKTIFVPLQISNDTVIKYFSGKISNLHKFIQKIIKTSENNKDILFLYKNHPLEKNLSINTDNLICADDFHFKACLDLCDLVLCINSGVGMQSMIYEKPCIIFGEAFYSFEGINYQFNESQDINKLIRKDLSFDIEKSERFLFWLNFQFYSNVIWNSFKGINSSTLEKVNNFRIWTEDFIYEYL